MLTPKEASSVIVITPKGASSSTTTNIPSSRSGLRGRGVPKAWHILAEGKLTDPILGPRGARCVARVCLPRTQPR